MTEASKRSPWSFVDGSVALCIAVACVVSANTALYSGVRPAASTTVPIRDAVAGILFSVAWQYCFTVLKLYDKSAHIASRLRTTCKGVLVMTVPFVCYLEHFYPHVIQFRTILLVLICLFSYEICRMAASAYLLDRLAARDPRRAIIVGSGRRASKAWREVRTRYHSSITLLGFVDDRSADEMPPEIASNFLCMLDELEETLVKEVVDLILVAMPIQSCYPIMQRAVQCAQSAGVQVIYLGDIYSQQKNRDPNESIFRELAPQQEHYLLRLAAKRALDIVASILGLIVLSPIFLLLAIGVKLSSPGPAFFCQERYGHRRRRFKMYKFRSMVQDAEQQLAHLEHANEAMGPIFKMRRDPRVTTFGKFIRATSLDELPQLLNVLRGEMSLVGPRPMSIRDVSLFSESALMRRFIVQPGMTGLWQVNGRSEVGFDEWMLLDNRYIDGWSLSLDLKILARTLGVVLKRSGAM